METTIQQQSKDREQRAKAILTMGSLLKHWTSTPI